MLLDNTYFEKYPTYIAGIDTKSDNEPTAAAESIIAEVNAYIDELEQKFLCLILGAEAAKNTTKESEFAPELAPIAAKYVYFFYERDHVTANTMAGEKVKITDSSRVASSQQRLVEVWNSMVDDCRNFVATHNGIAPDLCSDIFNFVNSFNL